MKITKNVNSVLLSILVFVLFSSCDNELHITLPQGPAGASAYDVWVSAVNDGTIDWDKNRTDINNFFLYLKGKDGADGQNGKSAYEIWKEEVTKGIQDPHNANQQWDKNKTSTQDFWYYLTGAKGQDGATPSIGNNGNWFVGDQDTNIPAKGENGNDGQDGSSVSIGNNGNWLIDGIDTGKPAFGKDGADGKDGQSAYELWISEVNKGIDDPHNPGQQWDKSKTSAQDFWEFLKGKDGKDGENGNSGPGGETGQPGKEIEIVKGKANVISQYQDQSHNEFVRWEDGGVAYIVYNDQGAKAANAKVKGLPGIKDPNKVYQADSNGSFIVPKEDLPTDKTRADRTGVTTEVEYLNSQGQTVKEVSAPNTYVPSKVDIRIQMYQLPDLTQTYIRVYPTIQRKVEPNGQWEQMPTYLGQATVRLKAFELSNSKDPASFSPTASPYANNSITVSDTDLRIDLYRMKKKSDYHTPTARVWDELPHYYTLYLDSYYGESTNAGAVIEMAPIQCMPLIKNLSATEGSTTILTDLEGEFDIARAKIDPALLFKKELVKDTQTNGSASYDYYAPVVASQSEYTSQAMFKIVFNGNGGKNLATNSPLAAISNSHFGVDTPYLNSTVELTLPSTNHYFYNLNTIGTLKYSGNKLIIEKTNSSAFNFANIDIAIK